MVRTPPQASAGVPRLGIAAGHLPQLDGLRFVAILGVLMSHAWDAFPLPWIFHGLDTGHVGVRLFFVLSGFLISGILLDCRRRAEERGDRRSVLVRRFYVRRFLRIHPLYYAVLAVLLLWGLEPTRQIWPWLLSYTTNLYISLHRQWIGTVGIFWTLAVEEQFYLVWPFILLFTPRPQLMSVVLATCALGPLYRLFVTLQAPGDVLLHGDAMGTFTLAVFDTLGMGALIALVAESETTGARLRWWLTRFALPVGGIGVLMFLVVLHYDGKTPGWTTIDFVVGETLLALVLAWVVGSASLGFGGPVGRFLASGPVSYLGKISYGIYVFHAFVPMLLRGIGHRFGVEYRGNPGALNFVLVSTTTFAIAAVSWRIFERPLNDLKRHFPYRDD